MRLIQRPLRVPAATTLSVSINGIRCRQIRKVPPGPRFSRFQSNNQLFASAPSITRRPTSTPTGRHASSKSNWALWCG